MVHVNSTIEDTHSESTPARWRPIKRILAAILVFGGGAALATWATRTPSAPEVPIAQQWMDAVSQLGVEPAYPPQEDIAVGDILAIIASDATKDISGTPLSLRAIKLWHTDMTAEIEQAYRETYQFPETEDRPAEGKIWRQGKGNGPLFKIGQERRELPILVLPEMTVATVRAATANAGFLSGIAATFGFNAGSAVAIRLKIEGAETYGVPAIPAEWKLYQFCQAEETKPVCTDHGLRLQLSAIAGGDIYERMPPGPDGRSRPRFAVELALISRVFLTRSIETVIERTGGVSAKAATSDGAQLSSEAAPVARDMPPKSTGVGPDVAQPNGQTGFANAAAGSAATNLTTTTPRPGASTSAKRLDASTLAVTQALQRPVVVAFRTVRWRPSK